MQFQTEIFMKIKFNNNKKKEKSKTKILLKSSSTNETIFTAIGVRRVAKSERKGEKQKVKESELNPKSKSVLAVVSCPMSCVLCPVSLYCC